MPSFSKMRVADLRKACDELGLNHDGLIRKDLIALLIENNADEATEDSSDVETDQNGENSDNDSEIEIEPAVNGGIDEPIGSKAELEMQTLKLKVELANAEQKAREAELKAHRQQLELEKARWEMEKERRQFRAEHGLPPETAGVSNQRDLKGLLPIMGDDQHALSFFHAYEKTLQIEKVDKSLWAKWLPACLNQKASKVYTALTVEQCQDYDTVKKTVLESFRLTSRKYLENFRGMRRSGAESYRLFLNKLKETLKYFMEAKEVDTLDKLVEQVLLEQFLDGLPPVVRQFVEARQPSTAVQAAELADLQFETQQSVHPKAQYNNRWPKGNGTATAQTAATGASNNAAGTGSETRVPQRREATKGPIKCYTCGGNHKAAECSSKNTATRQANGPARYNAAGARPAGAAGSSNTSSLVKTVRHTGRLPADANMDYVCPIYLNGFKTVGFRDSGSNITLVNSKFVTNECKRSGNIQIQGVTGVTTKIPICEIPISSPRFNNGNAAVTVRAGYFDALEYDALLGNDMFRENPELQDIFEIVKTPLDINAGGKSHAQVGTLVKHSGSNEASANLISTETANDKQEPPRTTEPSQSVAAASSNKQAISSTRGIESDTEMRGRRPYFTRSVAAQQRSRSEGRPPLTAGAGQNLFDPLSDTNKQCRQKDYTAVTDSANVDHAGSLEPRGAVDSNKQPDNKTAQLLQQGAGDTPARQLSAGELIEIASPSSEADPATNCEFERLANISHDLHRGDNYLHGRGNKDCIAFAEAQASDPSLTHAWGLARSGRNDQYIIRNGLLFERKQPWVQSDHESLLLVPEKYIQTVLQTAHDDIKGGCHLGTKKTMHKINAAGLTFPKLRSTVKSWVGSCMQCQRTAARRTADRVPMRKVPMVGQCFEEIIIDVVGPEMKTTIRRNRYALVVVDAATRFVEILPLRNLKASTVADAMLTGWFFRFGTPKVIKFDQQSSLMSQTWTAVLKKLDVDSHISVAYLHHATAMAEIKIKAIERVLKCYINEYPNNWDTSLPYVSFALNDAPCETTSFSAHELVYGRRLRSPLHVLRETWSEPDGEELALKTNVISYLTELCNKLQTVNELAQEHASGVQDRVKTWYDKKSRERVLEPGDKVLVLLPEDGRKMHAFWRGPFEVLRRIGDFNYEISMGQRKNTIMHINMLKKFNERVETVSSVIAADAEDGENYDFPITVDWTEGPREFNIGGQLTDEQQRQLLELLQEFDDVFSDRPGRTHLITHSIKLSDPTPHAQAPYKVPVKLQERVDAELDRLLAEGLIVESDSPWAAPLVCVTKRNSDEVRLCCNWKQLNSQTIDDAYPSADPNDILARAAGAKFISTIDLRQGFWQIPLSPESIPLSAFRTQRGQFSWCVAGMGLKTSGKTMQRLMDKIMKGCSKWCGTLLDDAVVYSTSWTSTANTYATF